MNKHPENSGRLLLSHSQNCLIGQFRRRIKRFTVEIEYQNSIVKAHCNNTGAMTGLLAEGTRAIFSQSENPLRKLPFTLEGLWVEKQTRGKNTALCRNTGFWAGVNTLMPNRVLAAAFSSGLLEFAVGMDSLRREVTRGSSRLDGCFYKKDKAALWVECKNVTLVDGNTAYFPDAASARARRHLLELMEIVRGGSRGAMFYLVQRPDADFLAPASFVDEEYASLFIEARNAGVEMYAQQVEMTLAGIYWGRKVGIKSG